MAVIKINDTKTSVTIIGDDGVQYGTSVYFLQGLLSGRSKLGFIELHRYPNKSSDRKWRKSPVLVAGEKIPYEVFYKDTKEEDAPVVDLMDKKVREAKRQKDSFAVDDKVW